MRGKDLKGRDWCSVHTVSTCPGSTGLCHPLLTPTGCGGTTADLAMSYWKEYPSPCAFCALGMLTPHRRMHQDKASGGKSDWGVSCSLKKSRVLLIQPNAGRRCSKQMLESKGELPLFLKVSLFNPELLLVTWFGCCSPFYLISAQSRWGWLHVENGEVGMWLVDGDSCFFPVKKNNLKWVAIRRVKLQWCCCCLN